MHKDGEVTAQLLLYASSVLTFDRHFTISKWMLAFFS